MLYMVVVQAVMLFSSKLWVLSAAMEGKAEGTHTGFL